MNVKLEDICSHENQLLTLPSLSNASKTLRVVAVGEGASEASLAASGARES
jgi:hypothetical protein